MPLRDIHRVALTSIVVAVITLAPALDAGQTGAQSVEYRSPSRALSIDRSPTRTTSRRHAPRWRRIRRTWPASSTSEWPSSGARQFREAIATFTRGLQIEPDNALLLRWRGHRYLSVREFDRAFADLTRGSTIDGTIYGIWYHLGVVQYVRGNFADAAASFAKAQPIAPDAGELAGSTDWLWMSLSRAGRHAEAKAMLDRRPDSKPVSNAYARRLQLYRGEITRSGHHASGYRRCAAGHPVLRTGELVSRARGPGEGSRGGSSDSRAGGWPAFGFIVWEVELRRLR